MGYYESYGTNLFYEVKGNPEGAVTVAFFNGVMASTSSWYGLLPVFEKLGFKIILHDFKGQLKSDKPVGPYTFEAHCMEAKSLFDHLGCDKVHIIGTSYGGEIAMKFAMIYPESTLSIAIIDSVSEIDEVMRGFVNSWSSLIALNDGEAFFWGMAPSIYGPGYMKDNYEMLTKRAIALKSVDPDYFVGQKILYETFLKEVVLTESLSLIQCPALVICGEEDILKPPKFSRLIASRIDRSELFILPNCGHVAIFEKPEALVSVLLGFIVKQG